jgi:hypothetical protein
MQREDLSRFQKEFDLDERLDMSSKMKNQHKDCVPVIVERCPESRAPRVGQKKFLATKGVTIPTFLKGLKDFIKSHGDGVREGEDLHLFVNAEERGRFLLDGEGNMVNIYEEYKSKDGFLYILFSHFPTLF